MSTVLPKIRVGDPAHYQALSVFPLFTDGLSSVDYRLADEAMRQESLLVTEVDEGGSVPDLLVENKGDVRVLFLEGEELVGAKQNRILNTSVLVAAHSKTKIPVSCVERGRWHYRSRNFGSGGSHSPSGLRHVLKSSVSRSVRAEHGYCADQLAVWGAVAGFQAAHDVQSPTEAMSDTFSAYEERINAYREALTYVDGATGVAVAIGEKVVVADVFDKPSTCQQVWNRMLSGVIMDALQTDKTEQYASAVDVERFLAAIGDLAWQPAPAVGEGQEYRADSRRGDHASALALNDTVVHGSAMAAV